MSKGLRQSAEPVKFNDVFGEKIRRLKNSLEKAHEENSEIYSHAINGLVSQLESIVGAYREYERMFEEAKAILPSEEYAKLLAELGTEEK